jgi:hypothetical protein
VTPPPDPVVWFAEGPTSLSASFEERFRNDCTPFLITCSSLAPPARKDSEILRHYDILKGLKTEEKLLTHEWTP